MARIKLHLPTIIHFSTEIPVRITDVNYGGHLGNDALLWFIHEARDVDEKSIGLSLSDEKYRF
jgi:acyl-CoA thioesterase FadM